MKALKQNIWILFMILGVIGFGIVWFAMPHNSAIPNFGVLGFKFLVFGFIIFGIGFGYRLYAEHCCHCVVWY